MTLIHTMVQYATLWAIADITEQRYISKKPQQDWQKSFRMVTVGTFVVAPLVFGWIRLAERIFPGKHWYSVCKKVLMDQVVFAPIAVSSFYASTCCLERKSFQQFKEEWKKKFPRTYFVVGWSPTTFAVDDFGMLYLKYFILSRLIHISMQMNHISGQNGMKIWPAVQLINFSFVPVVHRPKVISCVSFGWSIYLCFQKEDLHNENEVSSTQKIEVDKTVVSNSAANITSVKSLTEGYPGTIMRKKLTLMAAETEKDCVEKK